MASAKISSYNQHGGGGINNQKMAVIGAVVNAFEKGIPFAIPMISEMDQNNHNYEKYEYNTLFREDIIRDILEKYSISVVPYSIDLDFDVNYEDCFWKTYHLLANSEFLNKDDRGQLIFDLIGAFVPRVIETPVYQRLTEAINNRNGQLLFCQFRIEKDWIVHCKNEIVKVRSAAEELYVDYMKIGLKISNTFPDVRNVFVCADEPAMPVAKSQIKSDLLEMYGIRALFKTDFIDTAGSDFFRPNEHSLIDMALCVDGMNFAGTTRSTFSNMVALQRYSASCHKEPSYVYNHLALRLKKRVDNGAAASVEHAVPVSGTEVCVLETHIAKTTHGDTSHPVLLRAGEYISSENAVADNEKIIVSNARVDERLNVDGSLHLDREKCVFV